MTIQDSRIQRMANRLLEIESKIYEETKSFRAFIHNWDYPDTDMLIRFQEIIEYRNNMSEPNHAYFYNFLRKVLGEDFMDDFRAYENQEKTFTHRLRPYTAIMFGTGKSKIMCPIIIAKAKGEGDGVKIQGIYLDDETGTWKQIQCPVTMDDLVEVRDSDLSIMMEKLDTFPDHLIR